MDGILTQERYYDMELPIYTMFVVYTELPRLYEAYGGRMPFDFEYENVEDMMYLALMHRMPAICKIDDPEYCKKELKEYAIDGFKRTMLFTFLDWNLNVNSKVLFPFTKLEANIVLCVIDRFIREDGSAPGEVLYEREKKELNEVRDYIINNIIN